ncbi:hypothetical protein GCM10010502_72580 [Kitasatospora aureofaciens]|uniref:Uncharacterized protein n=1 Tax=Kitasatospora aureofaciens TaxID=1894 RepID=A0A8H9I0J0_KITAU|nr:hypothetical protein GCM10010502_72580 [Kitasatospora aureofaciens]
MAAVLVAVLGAVPAVVVLRPAAPGELVVRAVLAPSWWTSSGMPRAWHGRFPAAASPPVSALVTVPFASDLGPGHCCPLGPLPALPDSAPSTRPPGAEHC